VGWLHTVAKAFPVPQGAALTPSEPPRAVPAPAPPAAAPIARKPAPVTPIAKLKPGARRKA
jgi:hypothetical protein